jgi:hypothetical protein
LRIVWARDLGDNENARLMEYFHDRSVWMVDTNVQPATIAPYAPEGSTRAVANAVR